MEPKRKSAHSNVKPKTPRHHHHNKLQLDKHKMKEMSRRMFLMNESGGPGGGALLSEGSSSHDLFAAIEVGNLEAVRRLVENPDASLDINR